jgi:hypothetical protein
MHHEKRRVVLGRRVLSFVQDDVPRADETAGLVSRGRLREGRNQPFPVAAGGREEPIRIVCLDAGTVAEGLRVGRRLLTRRP